LVPGHHVSRGLAFDFSLGKGNLVHPLPFPTVVPQVIFLGAVVVFVVLAIPVLVVVGDWQRSILGMGNKVLELI
jgi:hypothetical protein